MPLKVELPSKANMSQILENQMRLKREYSLIKILSSQIELAIKLNRKKKYENLFIILASIFKPR